MGVDVKREAGGGVAQHILDALYICAAGDCYGSSRVSEVVGPCVQPANVGHYRFEPFVKGVDRVMLPGFIREYQCPDSFPELFHPVWSLSFFSPLRHIITFFPALFLEAV